MPAATEHQGRQGLRREKPGDMCLPSSTKDADLSLSLPEFRWREARRPVPCEEQPAGKPQGAWPGSSADRSQDREGAGLKTAVRGKTETSSPNHTWYENVSDTASLERVTGKKTDRLPTSAEKRRSYGKG